MSSSRLYEDETRRGRPQPAAGMSRPRAHSLVSDGPPRKSARRFCVGCMRPLRRVLTLWRLRWSRNKEENPDRYLETFVVSSWAEHPRQHDRLTRADSHVEDQLRRCTASEPKVRHLLYLW